MIPEETKQLILDTAQVADVVGDYVTLKRRGASYVACCPFHNEKTPSFYVTPSKGIYKCFGCGKSGTAVGFVMEMEHCSYPEALRYLARKYHIEVIEKEEDPEEIARRQRNESLLLVSEFAQKFFKESLQSPEGQAVAAQYYAARGITDETVERFGLGWAPSSKTGLIDKALAAGYKLEYLVAAGLAVEREDGSMTDKFRERVMFPIHSVSGRVIAYSGRTLHADNPAKYVNSPETEIYVKSRNLLGIYFAKSEISRLNKCILVEGNVDMVMMHQLGIRNVVASCGTSLTVEQIRLIHKFTENITIMYDGDSAGIHAALRGINMILAEGMNVKIVLLPDGDDPDSFSRKRTLAEVEAYIAGNETDFISFKTSLLLNEAKGDPLRKAELINDIADTIAEVPDAVKRSTYVEFTASEFRIESGILFDRIRKVRKKMQEDARKAVQREKIISERAPEIVNSQPETAAAEAADNALENKVLAPAERDLIEFLLTHGCDLMEFQSDSEYYCENDEDRFTVADLIRESLESDGTIMENTAYAKVYDAFYVLYDEGLEQAEIVKGILDSPDRGMARTAADLSDEKYKLSVSAFRNAMTITPQWLAVSVPKALMHYAERRLEDKRLKLQRSLADSTDSAEQEALLTEIMSIQKYQILIKEKIGRDKKI